ncbi:hypothetical protein K7X08_011798 [Anisodus acutangulus]|uniref:Uncharacterized protein n=1 Tax=Anisodus acutangulus TaxID=402998 RepID=A0A9Q1MQQ7_9SOLA|nr:hypothetical protein K7X08_011798 [Anisodus acutangulus]
MILRRDEHHHDSHGVGDDEVEENDHTTEKNRACAHVANKGKNNTKGDLSDSPDNNECMKAGSDKNDKIMEEIDKAVKCVVESVSIDYVGECKTNQEDGAD